MLIQEKAEKLEEALWSFVYAVDAEHPNEVLKKAQMDAFDLIMTARDIQKQPMSRVEIIVADMRSKGFDVDVVPRYLKQKESVVNV
ncbi:hypothetical protein ACTHAL_001429 [Priestia flexa]|uniref:hypothetical protein n=1 Tax=Priestia flexa TaxID=86664 RepID=UPI001CFF01D7|nr:hypothetical protein [Priestia flexa]